MLIRDFIPGEQATLRQVFMSSVHELARGFYTKEQLDAWAPPDHDPRRWAERMSALRPFVATVDGRVAGYADLQDSGLIDHFFVSGRFARRGVGSALMGHIHREAARRAIPALSSHVSLAAESFFARHGFRVVRRQSVVVDGIPLDNAVMARQLPADGACGPTPLRGTA